jgi:hypothetical protein
MQFGDMTTLFNPIGSYQCASGDENAAFSLTRKRHELDRGGLSKRDAVHVREWTRPYECRPLEAEYSSPLRMARRSSRGRYNVEEETQHDSLSRNVDR